MTDVSPTDPVRQEAMESTGRLLERAAAAGRRDPWAGSLATGDLAGRISVRMVLLRGFDDRGFVFYTHHQSLKGRQLAAHPRAALCFYWEALGEQLRVEGRVEQVPAAESDAYWETRSRASRLGALASLQSRPLASREDYEEAVAAAGRRGGDGPLPRPPGWGGYLVRPDCIELWEQRTDRMHHRRLYARSPAGWTTSLLYP